MKVKIWNDSDSEYHEMFRDKRIVIPARSYIEMGRAEGNKFLSSYAPVVVDGAGRLQNPKKLRMEKPAEEFAELTDQPLRYTAKDGKLFRSIQGKDEHEKALPENVNYDQRPVRRKKVQTIG